MVTWWTLIITAVIACFVGVAFTSICNMSARREDEEKSLWKAAHKEGGR